jgi:hypothetical protein
VIKLSRELVDRSAYAQRIGEMYRIMRENVEDPWFQREVKKKLEEGFYFLPDLDKYGMVPDDPDREWVAPDDPDVERKAWLMVVKACQNGWRRHDPVKNGEGA